MSSEIVRLTSEQPLLSIVIPAYNEQQRLPQSLRQIRDFVSRQPYAIEVIVVDNNSTDHTRDIAEEFVSEIHCLRVLIETIQGKGAAVRTGMLAAHGAYRFICDADLSMPITEVNRFLPPALPEIDVVIGSREAPGAVRYNEPMYRHLIGRGFNTVVRLLALPGLQDTQAGFKCFRAAVAEDVFRCQTLTGMSFDVEVLFIARLRGYKLVEVPIPWYFNADSRVRLLQDSLRMGIDLFTIRRNAARGVYDCRKPAA